MYLVDSDFDTDDEAYGDDIEEVISNHIGNSSANSGDNPNSRGAPLELDDDDLFVKNWSTVPSGDANKAAGDGAPSA